MLGTTRKRTALTLLFLCLLLTSLPAEQLGLGPFGSFIDPPDSWGLIGEESHKLTFVTPDEGAYLQIKRYQGIDSLDALVKETESRLGAKGEGTTYPYGEGEAYFGGIDFSTGNFTFSGYLFAYFSAELEPVVLIGFADADRLGAYNDYILSAIDSYSPLPKTDRLPGPVAAFDRVFSAGSEQMVALNLFQDSTGFMVDTGTVETASYVTEREARVLAADGTVSAWRRFFRIIYRDSIQGLSPLIEELHAGFAPESGEPRQIAEELLLWLQGFEYRRSGTFSDFLDPIQALVSSAGDCDSLGLLYVLLLHSFDIDAILLVSESYGHALGAAAVPGGGAAFTVEGREYVVAEMTEEVDLGLIAADMADPAGWIPVRFPENIRARAPR